MATIITSEHGVKKRDYFMIHPNDVIIDSELRGRTFNPSKEKVERLAESIIENGQLQAVEVRKVSGNKVKMVAGYTRHEAVSMIIEKDPDFRLKCVLVNVDEATAVIHNIIENAIRSETSAVDDAHNINHLLENHGKSEVEIAKIYGKSQSWVHKCVQLVRLPMSVQEQIHTGVLSAAAGVDLLDLDEDAQKKAITAATKENGKVNGAVVKQIIRAIALEPVVVLPSSESVDGEVTEETTEATAPEPVEPGKKRPRTHRELKKYFCEATGVDDDDALLRFCDDIVKFLNGTITDKQMDNAMARIYEAVPEDSEE